MNSNQKIILLRQIEDLIKNHQIEHFYLYKNLLKTLDNDIEINSKWLLGGRDSWILGFCSNHNYQIYGVNYSDELLELLATEFDFNPLPNKHIISGNKSIWDFLFSRNPDISYSVAKNRYFYEIDFETFDRYSNDNVKIRLADLDDIDTLAKLHCDFFNEEYKGDNNKELSETVSICENLISKNQLILSENDRGIVGYCSSMQTEFMKEMIGTVYVTNYQRGLKIGKSLLSHMTKTLLDRNPKTYLFTDMTNQISNQMVKNLGYSIIFEYTSGEIIKL